ncbi:MAG: LysR family transcriptional regulator [Steroidobacteraceae bacterium]|nr:LysR family transcriptional regulator [Steroidobacteraceae bacterium]
MNLDLRQLRYILALDQYRSFARAAEAVGLTQPALTRSLQSLESSLGARLFDRDRSRVEPTPVGERLLERAQLLLNQARSIEQDVRQMVELEVGLLRIGAGVYPADLSVGTAVGRLLRRHPGLMADLAVTDWPELIRRVTSGEFDLVVADAEVARNDDRFSVEALPRHRGNLFCRAGHPLLGQAVLTLEEVRRYPLVASALPDRLAALGTKDKQGLRSYLPEGTVAAEIRVGSFALAQRIVMESDAIGAAAPTQIEHAVARGQLVPLDLDLPWLTTGYGIIRLKSRTPSPAAEAFMQILREVEAEIERRANFR